MSSSSIFEKFCIELVFFSLKLLVEFLNEAIWPGAFLLVS